MPSSLDSFPLFNLLWELVRGVLTNNNLNFFGLFVLLCSGPYQLYLDLLLTPRPGRWYICICTHIVCYYMVLRSLMHIIIPDSPQDLQGIWSAIPTLFSEMSTDILRYIPELHMMLTQSFFSIVTYFRKPTLGPGSCPWAIWAYWCYGSHYLLLVNLLLDKPEPSRVLYCSARYALGTGMLLMLYLKLGLFSRNQLWWTILVSAVPVSSHLIARLWEDTLRHTACISGSRPYLVGYSLAAILSSTLLFWIMDGRRVVITEARRV